MNKKFYIIVFLFLLILSCGKKGDPFYKKDAQNSENIQPKIVL